MSPYPKNKFKFLLKSSQLKKKKFKQLDSQSSKLEISGQKKSLQLEFWLQVYVQTPEGLFKCCLSNRIFRVFFQVLDFFGQPFQSPNAVSRFILARFY